MTDTLLTRLHQLAEEARQKVESAPTLDEVAYWRGVVFGLEVAIAEIEASRQKH